MRRTSTLLAAALALGVFVPASAALSPADLTAERAAVYDPAADDFLYLQAGEPALAAMGSTAKIMTIHVALAAVESGAVAFSDKLTISAKAAAQGCNCFNDVDGTLEDGDQMRLRDALRGVALSDGEPTVAVAEFVAKAVIEDDLTPNADWDTSAYWEEEFVGLMNDAVDDMGLAETHFMTPHGGDAEGQYTSAADLARIWSIAADAHPEFLEILGWWNEPLRVFHDGSVVATNYSAKLSHSYYPGVEGSKGGGSTECLACWVASAERLGRRLVVTNMQSTNNVDDAKRQFRAGFADLFEPQSVAGVGDAGKTTDHAVACSANDVVLAARNSASNLALQRWTADPDVPSLTKVGARTTTYAAKNVDIDRVNSNFVATVEQQPVAGGDRVNLRSWRWSGVNPVLVDTELAGRGTAPKVIRLTNDRVLTAIITADGYVLDTWQMDLTGGLTHLASRAETDAVTELDVDADLTGEQLLAVVRNAAGELVARGYTVDAATGAIAWSDEEVRGKASAVRVSFLGTGWYGGMTHNEEDYGTRWAMSYVRSNGRLGAAFWHWTASGLMHRATWGDSGEAATETAVAAIGDEGAIVASRGDDGGLHLAVAHFPWEHPLGSSSADYQVARTGPAAGVATQIETCRLVAGGAAGAQVTAVRTQTGKLSLSVWVEATD